MRFVALSRVNFPPESREDVHAVGLRMLELARRQPGFVSIAFHQSREADATMMIWEWESEADHKACMASPDWGEIMASSSSVFERPGTGFSIETFDRLA